MKNLMGFFVGLLAFVLINQEICSCLAQEGLATNLPPAQLEKDLMSTNAAVRFLLAEKLAQDHTKVTFMTLLKLLNDTNIDISYAAAQSIEARKDKAFDDELIAAIKTLSRDNRWPAYSAAKSYPTPHMLNYLWNCLEEEINFQRQRKIFDNSNCFYISKSLEQIAHSLGKNVKVLAPDNDGDLKDYQHFADGINYSNNDLEK